jgi:hypothetical protein
MLVSTLENSVSPAPSLALDSEEVDSQQFKVKIDAKSKIFRTTKRLLILESRISFSMKRHLCATCCQNKMLNILKNAGIITKEANAATERDRL